MKIPKNKDIVKYLKEHPTSIGLVDWSKRRSFPGFFSVPLYDIAVFLYNESRRNALQVRANSIAFSFMLALFPATIVLLSLLPYLPLKGFVDELENNISDIVPNNVLQVIMGFIRDITENTREGLLSLGFVLALFFASNGMMALLQGFDKKYQKSTFLSRNFYMQRTGCITISFSIKYDINCFYFTNHRGNVLIEYLTEYIKADTFTKGSFFFIRWLAILFLYYGSISVIYRFGPALKEKFEFFTPGATLATLLCILSSWLFSLYVNSFGTYNQLYGSLGVLIAFMLWLKLNAFILLVGFELNAAIAINRDLKRAMDDELEEDNRLT